MKYIKLFDSEIQYDLESEDFIYPTVSFLEAEDEVRYMPKPPHDYRQDYLTFEALEDGTFTFSIPAVITTNQLESVSYSTDNGTTWTTTNNTSSLVTITTPTITAGNKVLWKGIGRCLATQWGIPSKASCFSASGNFNVMGSVMSLLYGDDFADKTTMGNYSFTYLFYNNTKLVKANKLALPVATLTPGCYNGMFQGCTSLTTAPTLPATTMADYCYYSMFQGCTSLTTAPELPATTLVTSCYQYMFQGCTSLTTAPTLPATTLANDCYASMFQGCTSLTTAPALPATTLANDCYASMFQGCTSLTTAPTLAATTLVGGCYGAMFRGCTALTTAPTLPATTLQNYCYSNMFYGCTSLTTAPELPATTLVNYCYNSMFNGCTNLNYIKAMFTTAPSISYTRDWVFDVASTGTFVKNSAANWNVSGRDGVPSGWTVQTASE